MTCCRNSCCCCREPCCWSGWLGCCKLQSCYWFDCCTCCCCRRKAALPDCCSYCLASADWASCYARWDARAEDCKLLLYNRPHCVALPGSRGEGRTTRTGHWPAVQMAYLINEGEVLFDASDMIQTGQFMTSGSSHSRRGRQQSIPREPLPALF